MGIFGKKFFKGAIGVLGGAVIGFAVGGPVGAVVGGAAGFGGGKLLSSKGPGSLPPPGTDEAGARTKAAEAERTRKRRRRTKRVFTSPGGALIPQGSGGRGRLFGD